MTDIPEKPSHDVHPRVEAGLAGHAFESGSGIFFAAVEMTRMPMTVVDPNLPDQPIVFVNQAFLTMTGYEKSEVVGRNCRFLQGPDTDREAKARLRAAIEGQEDIAIELINHRKDGSAFWNALFVSPVHNAAGDLVYFFGSQLDISRRKQAEESLNHAQKMEALGQLTGGIAHDFNNLLQVILGYADSLATNLERPDADRARMGRAVGNIREAAERASTLTAQLLSFARKQRLEGRTLSLNKLVEEMRQLAGRTLGETIAIETDLAPGLWPCRLDPTQAEVALLNILINARDAMPEGGRVTIATRNREPSSPGGSRCVAVEITDTGTGIPSDVLARVMDPFFTTKEEGKGTGLGLSMVYGFAKQSGGTVQIESVMGEGTKVRLLFPASDEAGPEAQPDSPISSEPQRGSETVLVVDDRADVAELARAILRDYGRETARLWKKAVAHTLYRGLPDSETLKDIEHRSGKTSVMVRGFNVNASQVNGSGDNLVEQARPLLQVEDIRAATGGDTGLLDARDQGFFRVAMPEFWQRPEMTGLLRDVREKPDKYAWVRRALPVSVPAPSRTVAGETTAYREAGATALDDILRGLREDEDAG